jgi:hypothetical protein
LNLNDIIIKAKQTEAAMKSMDKDEDGFDRPTPLRIKSSNVSPSKHGSNILNSTATLGLALQMNNVGGGQGGNNGIIKPSPLG